MSIATRIESMNNNVKKVYNSLEKLGINLNNTNKNLENISNKINDIYQNWPKITGTGTTITLNNTTVASIQTQLKGNLNQNTTTGAQVFNLNACKANIEHNYGNAISGTANNFKIIRINAQTMTYDMSLDAGTYYIKGKWSTTYGNGQIIITYTDNTTLHLCSDYSNGSANGTINKTSDDEKTIKSISFVLYDRNSNFTLKDFIISKTDISYEPYTGGIPSPNPDYPQDIQVVTGENTIIISNEGNIENQTFDIDLGDLELCKINNIQDYIYKNNNEWYKKPMILKINNYNGETISTNYISTTGELSMNATVYYINPTLNPNGIQIKDEILINELNILEQAMSYNNQTNISQENDNLPFIISATALMKNSD